MTVAVFVTNESDAASLIPWGVHYASIDQTELLIVCPRRSKGKRCWDPLLIEESDENPLFKAVFETLDQQDPEKVVLKQQIAEGSASKKQSRVAIETREIVNPDPENAFVEEIVKLDISLLLLPAGEYIKGAKDRDNDLWTHTLFRDAPCQVAIVRGRLTECEAPGRILVASHGSVSADDEIAISRACQLARRSDEGRVTLLYVRPDDDEVARQIGEKHAEQLVRLRSDKKQDIETRVELADSLLEGIERLPLDEFDLLIVGTRKSKTIRGVLNCGISEDGPVLGVATVRKAVPLTDQVWSKFKHLVRSKVPQMDREYRVSLVDRLQNNSQFDFDFVALISLSTLIAALGLARNSGAVVIGAMLVAPLMTPLVAMGFALVQGNTRLIRDALKSVVLGFTVALAIGAVLGLMLHVFAPKFAVSSEMLSRGSPNLLDLVVALASGVAGAYAMGRPNLVSALPGVAIAAALVPPIATSGLALTMGDFKLSGGASLLFFTNIVAIVLGTAITFWAVGISTRKVSVERKSEQMWPRYWFIGCVLVSFLLAAGMSYFNPINPREAPKQTINKQSDELPKADGSDDPGQEGVSQPETKQLETNLSETSQPKASQKTTDQQKADSVTQ
jgi:uncharacterized hydrophobic protein (TIGR00271 family)